jgi:hypothetical protein
MHFFFEQPAISRQRPWHSALNRPGLRPSSLRRWSFRGPNRTLLDPALQQRQLGLGQGISIQWHEGLLDPRNAPIEPALLDLSRNYDRTVQSAGLQASCRFEAEAREFQGLVVARLTASRKDRQYPGLEELRFACLRLSRVSSCFLGADPEQDEYREELGRISRSSSK